jgi:phosphatidylinositol alpha-1,6-mannosyltransferase
MKIGIITNKFPPHVGGTSTLFYNISQSLDPNELVVIAKEDKNSKEIDNCLKFKIYRIPDLYDGETVNSNYYCIKQYFKSYFKIRDIAKKEKIDVFICNNFLSSPPIILLKKPYYIYCHGEEFSSKILGKFIEIIKHVSLRNAKGLIAGSDFTKNLVKMFNKNVKVIQYAVNTTKFKPIQKNKKLILKHKLSNKITIITMARLEKRKGIDQAISIIPDLIENNPNIQYLIIGDGNEREKLVELVKKLKINKNVKFLGRVKDKYLVEYYNLCDIFIMPNRELENGDTEGFGLVFLEANACGKPVIGGNAGGVPSAIKNGYNGFIVDGNDKRDIYEKTIKLINNRTLRERMGNNGLKWVKNFTYKRLVKEIIEFIELK